MRVVVLLTTPATATVPAGGRSGKVQARLAVRAGPHPTLLPGLVLNRVQRSALATDKYEVRMAFVRGNQETWKQVDALATARAIDLFHPNEVLDLGSKLPALATGCLVVLADHCLHVVSDASGFSAEEVRVKSCQFLPDNPK